MIRNKKVKRRILSIIDQMMKDLLQKLYHLNKTKFKNKILKNISISLQIIFLLPQIRRSLNGRAFILTIELDVEVLERSLKDN